MKNLKWLAFAGLAGVLVSGQEEPGKASEATPGALTNRQLFQVKGVITRVEPDGKMALIKHEAIPDYMQAMTMPFDVKDTNELATLKPGDAVIFQLVVTPEDGWIEQVKKTGVSSAPQPHESVRVVRDVDPLEVGDVMPDYHFTNELSQAIRLSDFKGQALAFTFLYTRCAYPDFCPRMSNNFAEVCKKLAAHPAGLTNWHLLSISFDPEWDTPPRLKEYAQRYRLDPRRWSFATGAMIDIDAITEQFGLAFAWRNATIDHTLRTVVVDAQGRIQQIVIGNEWKPDELVTQMVKAAQAQPKANGIDP